MDFEKGKKGFTLIEIIIVIVIIAVLGTLMIPAYFNVIEKSKNTVCETNQRVLLGALEMYAVENTVLPASLSQLPDKHIKRAWAKVLSEPGSWKIRVSYAISEFNFQPIAYAASGWLQEYLGLVKGPACPADKTPPPLNSSYGISDEFAGRPSGDLMNADLDDVVIADSDSAKFVNPTPRHTKYSLVGSKKFAITITRGNDIVRFIDKNDSDNFKGDDDCGECRVEFHECKKACPPGAAGDDCKKFCKVVKDGCKIEHCD